jgi:integrase
VTPAATKTWSPLELRTFLEVAARDRLSAAFRLMATSGLRRSETLGLRWTDVLLDEARLRVRQTLVLVGHEPVLRPKPKTASSRRLVALDASTVAALREHRRQQLEDRLKWGQAWTDSGLVFTREDGKPVHPDWFSKRFVSIVKTTDLPRIPLKNLRHTHATIALRAGVPAAVVQQRLGHSSVAITMDIYTDSIPAMHEEAAEQIAGLVRDAQRI